MPSRNCCAATSTFKRSWIKIRLVGTKSNKTGIGARIKVVAQTGTPVLTAKSGTPLAQIEEVRSCTAIIPPATCAFTSALRRKEGRLIEIRWPSGTVDTLKDLDVNRLYVIEEGGHVLKNEALVGVRKNLASIHSTQTAQRPLSCSVRGAPLGSGETGSTHLHT